MLDALRHVDKVLVRHQRIGGPEGRRQRVDWVNLLLRGSLHSAVKDLVDLQGNLVGHDGTIAEGGAEIRNSLLPKSLVSTDKIQDEDAYK